MLSITTPSLFTFWHHRKPQIRATAALFYTLYFLKGTGHCFYLIKDIKMKIPSPPFSKPSSTFWNFRSELCSDRRSVNRCQTKYLSMWTVLFTYSMIIIRYVSYDRSRWTSTWRGECRVSQTARRWWGPTWPWPTTVKRAGRPSCKTTTYPPRHRYMDIYIRLRWVYIVFTYTQFIRLVGTLLKKYALNPCVMLIISSLVAFTLISREAMQVPTRYGCTYYLYIYNSDENLRCT